MLHMVVKRQPGLLTTGLWSQDSSQTKWEEMDEK